MPTTFAPPTPRSSGYVATVNHGGVIHIFSLAAETLVMAGIELAGICAGEFPDGCYVVENLKPAGEVGWMAAGY